MIAFSNIFELLTLNEIKKTIPRKKDLEMPNLLSDFEKTNGLLRNSVFNRRLGWEGRTALA